MISVVLTLSFACTPKEEEELPVVDAPSESDPETNEPVVTTPSYGFLFTTTATTNGAFAYTVDGPDLSLAADPMCATEAGNRGLSGVFKAVLGVSGVRVRSSDWVLKNSTQYRRPDGTIIGSTDSTGALQFPLTNSISATNDRYWTGLQASTEPQLQAHCGRWIDTGHMFKGEYGDGSATSSAAWSAGDDDCGTQNKILCAEMIAKTTTLPAQANYRRIFVTQATVQAGTGLVGADGARRFDDLCQSEADDLEISDLGFTSYKAMVHTNTTTGVLRRLSCLTSNCGNGPGEAVNWVLEPNTQYRRVDGTTVIGTTTANAIFDFPLQNSFASTSRSFWTGFTESWASPTNSSVGNCSFFQSNEDSSGVEATVGDSGVTTSAAVNSGLVRCAQQRAVLCVEQKRTQNVFKEYPGYN